MESTETGLIELARLSDKQALTAFSRYLGVSAVVLGIGSVFSERFFVSEIQELLFAGAILLGWGALSINAWSKNRAQILENFMLEAKQDVKKFVKYYLVFSGILVLLVTAIALLVGSFAYANLAPVLFFVIAGVAVIVSVVAVANSISLAMVFGPALLVLAYLWVAIFLARAVVAVGRARLQNALVLYSIVFTLYLGLLSLPVLRTSLSIPALCQ